MEEEKKNTGQFQKGQSGNPRGRPSKRRMTHRTSAGYRIAMLEVADTPVSVTNRATGETEVMTLLHANMLALGHKGASGHSPSAKAFLEKHFEAAGVNGELTQLHRYLMEDNARLTLMVEELQRKLTGRYGGVHHVEVPEEDCLRLVGAMEQRWRNRKVSVDPQT